MVLTRKLVGKSLHFFRRSSLSFSTIHSLPSSHLLMQSIRVAVETKIYQQIPDLLNASRLTLESPNPFSFLSDFPQHLRTEVIYEIIQSFIPLRPRSRLQIAYAFLLSYTLRDWSSLPLALVTLQRTLRSGCAPAPQTPLLLSRAWLDHRKRSDPVSSILQQMQSLGYHPDCGTCNYIISSLCKTGQPQEAIMLLKGMSGAGCIPDLDSYSSIVHFLCESDTAYVDELMKEMIMKYGLTPRQEMIIKVFGAMRAKKDIWRAVKMIEFLQSEGTCVGFEGYELVAKGCLECREFVLAAKVVVGMTEKGFIPCIGVRQKVVEGLARIGEWKLAYTVRQKLVQLKS